MHGRWESATKFNLAFSLLAFGARKFISAPLSTSLRSRSKGCLQKCDRLPLSSAHFVSAKQPRRGFCEQRAQNQLLCALPSLGPLGAGSAELMMTQDAVLINTQMNPFVALVRCVWHASPPCATKQRRKQATLTAPTNATLSAYKPKPNVRIVCQLVAKKGALDARNASIGDVQNLHICAQRNSLCNVNSMQATRKAQAKTN